MKPVAIIQTDVQLVDTIIIWEAADRLVAHAYLNGKTTMTTALNSANPTKEALQAFHVPEGQLTRLHNWSNQPAQRVTTADRWN